MATVTIIDNRAERRWEGDREGLDALAALRKQAATARFHQLWRMDAEGGHPDPAVRDYARGLRAERAWPDQLHAFPIHSSDNDPRNALVAGWTGWPDLPKLSWGPCATCANSQDGRERGYAYPCAPCARPSHSHYLPADMAGQTVTFPASIGLAGTVTLDPRLTGGVVLLIDQTKD